MNELHDFSPQYIGHKHREVTTVSDKKEVFIDVSGNVLDKILVAFDFILSLGDDLALLGCCTVRAASLRLVLHKG